MEQFKSQNDNNVREIERNFIPASETSLRIPRIVTFHSRRILRMDMVYCKYSRDHQNYDYSDFAHLMVFFPEKEHYKFHTLLIRVFEANLKI